MKLKDFFFLSPAFLMIGFSIIKIIEDGLFSIKGVPIPWTFQDYPHALTVIIWCIFYIVLYLRTRHLTWWVRITAIISLSVLSTSITHDVAWIVEMIIIDGSFSPLVGSKGYPTFFILNVIALIYLCAFNMIHNFLRLNKWFLIMLGLFCLSLIILAETGFWQQWQLYKAGVGEDPHSWSWLFFVASGQLMWLTLLKPKKIYIYRGKKRGEKK